MKALDACRMELSGTHLVEASAGTGKTYTISTLFLRLVLERCLPVSQILVVTYTRAATAELRERIRRRLQDALALVEGHAEHEDPALLAYMQGRVAQRETDRARLALAISGFDEAAISTIHGFCQRALGDTALESQTAFEVEFIEDERPMQRTLARDFWALQTFDASLQRLQSLQAAKLGLSAVESLVARAASASLPVIPEYVDDPPPPDVEGWRRIRDRAVRMWDGQRAEVLALLASPALKGNSYGDKPRAGLVTVLDGLSTASPGGLDGDKLSRLTPEGMAARTKNGKAAPQHPLFDACTELLCAEQDFSLASERLGLFVRRQVVDYARAERKRRTVAEGVQGFDDLLTQLAEGLSGSQREPLLRKLRATYGAALIDEFQDTDPLQYHVFADVFGGGDRPLLLIGDPKQAIYGFRGADIFAYLQAAQAASEQCHTLTVNYRSDPGMVEAVNRLFAQAQAPFLFEQIAFHPVSARPGARDRLCYGHDAPLQFLIDEEGDDLSAAVATEVVALLSGAERIAEGTVAREVLPRDIAILCRRNSEARQIHAALAERGVPCVLEGDSSVFDLPIAEELQRVMSAMAFPDDPRHVRAALATSLCGVTAEELLALEGADQDWELWVERFMAYHHTWLEVGFVQAFQRMMDGIGVSQNLLARRDGERRLTDLLHLSELLHAAATRQRLGPLSLLQWLSDMRSDEDARSAVPESAQVRLESDAHVLRVTTVHKSKGLEYGIVFCPYLWAPAGLFRDERGTPRFHDVADGMRLKMDLGSEQLEVHREAAEQESIAEGLRLLYVALTRARHRTYIGIQKAQSLHLVPLLYLANGGGGVEAVAALKGIKADKALDAVMDCVQQGAPRLAARALMAPGLQRYQQALDTQRYLVRTCEPPSARFALQSFSGISSSAHRARPAVALEEALDHDLGTGLPLLGVEAAGDADDDADVTLADFPGGARMGTLIHHVYEHLDFLDADEPRVLSQVEQSLAEFAEDAGLAPLLSRAVMESLQACFDAGGFCLNTLSRDARLDEMEFMLRAGSAKSLFGLRQLQAVFAGADDAWVADYAQRLAGLSTEAFTGFLRGFIDLVYRHEGRYYLLDYKSNHLGKTFRAYGPGSMREAMVGSHYVLQYHLYTVALDRYLQLRLPGYSYDAHFGGVYYLFVRGMSPSAKLGNGVFYDRPSQALVSGLWRAIAGEGA